MVEFKISYMTLKKVQNLKTLMYKK